MNEENKNEELLDESIEEIVEQPEAKQVEEIDYEDRYKRALAEHQNLLKQTAREKLETIKYANENLLVELLPVYSNLKVAIAQAGEENSAWLEGVKFVTKNFKEVLTNAGIEEIETAGKTYDHNVMEALSEEVTADKKQEAIVAKELVSGYKLNGRLIMPAKVVVYKFNQ